MTPACPTEPLFLASLSLHPPDLLLARSDIVCHLHHPICGRISSSSVHSPQAQFSRADQACAMLTARRFTTAAAPTMPPQAIAKPDEADTTDIEGRRRGSCTASTITSSCKTLQLTRLLYYNTPTFRKQCHIKLPALTPLVPAVALAKVDMPRLTLTINAYNKEKPTMALLAYPSTAQWVERFLCSEAHPCVLHTYSITRTQQLQLH
jgi:hypothetical protein